MSTNSLGKLTNIGHEITLHVADPNINLLTNWTGYTVPAPGFIVPNNPYIQPTDRPQDSNNIKVSTGFDGIELGTPSLFIEVPLDGTTENSLAVSFGGGFVKTDGITCGFRVSADTNSVDVDVTNLVKWYMDNGGSNPSNRFKLLGKGSYTKPPLGEIETPYGYIVGQSPDGLRPSESYMITQPSGDVDDVTEVVVDPARRASVQFYSFGETADQYGRMIGCYRYEDLITSTDIKGATYNPPTTTPYAATVTRTVATDISFTFDLSQPYMRNFWGRLKHSIEDTNITSLQIDYDTTLGTGRTTVFASTPLITETTNSVIVSLSNVTGDVVLSGTNVPLYELKFTFNLGIRPFFSIRRGSVTSTSAVISGDTFFDTHYPNIDKDSFIYFPLGVTLTSPGAFLSTDAAGPKRFKIKQSHVNADHLRLELQSPWTLFSGSTSSSSNTTINWSTGLYRPKLIVSYGTEVEPPPTCLYSIAPSTAAIGNAAGSGTIAVTTLSNCAWSGSSTQTWIHLGSGGVGNGTLNYSWDENTTQNQRTGIISVNGQTFTITQAAADCQYSTTISNTNLGTAAGSGTLEILTTANCLWNVSSSDYWLNVSPPSGAGNANVSYSWTENTLTSSRTATIFVYGAAGNIVSQHTVTQMAAVGCVYEISGSNYVMFDMNGGRGSVSINTYPENECVWEASVVNPWIQLDESSGIGDAVIGFTCDANGENEYRSNTIIVGGQYFQVTQSDVEGNPPFVVNGSGFSQKFASTGEQENTLSSVGDASHIAYHNCCVARWVEPLYETYVNYTNIPLLAYHISGISRVVVSLNGGPEYVVDTPTYNSVIGITCYNIPLNPSSYPTNEYNELRAIVYPNSGIPQILQGEAFGGRDFGGGTFGSTAQENIKYGHHSLFFATNGSGNLRIPNYYVNGVGGSDSNSGLTSTAPKLTIESALIASGQSNITKPRHVDGTIIHLMDNGGTTVDYYLGTPGATLFASADGNYTVSNLLRPVVFKPFTGAKVQFVGMGNTAGLRLVKYKFENLTISENLEHHPSTVEGGFGGDTFTFFKFQTPRSVIFENPNPINSGNTFEVGSVSESVTFLLKDCYLSANFQKDFDWSYYATTYTPPPLVADPPYNGFAIYPKHPRPQWMNTSEITTARARFWYGISGWTFNPHWGTSSDSENAAYENRNTELFESSGFLGGAIVGCTLEHMGAVTRVNPRLYLVRNSFSHKAHSDVWRDVCCLVNCEHDKLVGSAVNVGFTLAMGVTGLGLTVGTPIGARQHADIFQLYPGRDTRRNIILYGVRSLNFFSQGPFFSSGHGVSSAQLLPDNPQPSDYDPFWNEYRDVTTCSAMRDIVIDKCTFIKSSENANNTFTIGEFVGNFIIKNSIIGKTNTHTGTYRHSMFDVTYENSGDINITTATPLGYGFGHVVRPCLVEFCCNGGPTHGPDRSLFMAPRTGVYHPEYLLIPNKDPLVWESMTPNPRTLWGSAVPPNPDYWVTPPLSPGFTLGVFIYKNSSNVNDYPTAITFAGISYGL